VIPREAGIIILMNKVPKAASEKLVPLRITKVELTTMRLAGMGTIICSSIHPKNTAKDVWLIIKDSMDLIIVVNMTPTLT
jgi:hypothetical protein